MIQSRFYTDDLTQSTFIKGVGILCIAYLILEVFLIPHLMLAYDEFWFAQHIYQYTQQLPYRDFLPYKTVLGYYFLTLPMWFFHEVFTPLFLIKDQIAFFNTIALCVISIYGMHFFNKLAILITLVFIISNQLFLFYSVDLRVDMLSSWLGLISVLFILNQRNSLAGLCLGLSFLISQKTLWFFVAINCAYVATLLLKNPRRQNFWELLSFNFWTCLCVGSYFLFWAILAKPAIVFNSMFYEAYTQSKITWYSQVYMDYWKIILSNGPLPIVLIPFTWLTLLFAPITRQRIFILTFSTVMLILFASYQQPFPYNIVLMIPVFFLVYSDFITELFSLWNHSQPSKKLRTLLLYLTSIYIIGLITLFITFEISVPYFLILLIPICLSLYIHKPQPMLITLIVSTFFVMGIFYPLKHTIELSFALNNNYQKITLTLLNDLLKTEGGYIAGTPLLYQKQQSIPGLENLISPAIAYLYTGSRSLLPILIPSLHLVPTTPQKIIQHFKNQPVKAYVNNNRMMHLPPTILEYLHAEFSHYMGSIYIYTPTIQSLQTTFKVKFAGLYQLLTTPTARVWIDHQLVAPNAMILLNTHNHFSKADISYRLKFIPTNPMSKPSFGYQKDTWQLTVV